jgi:hypothetical protein
MVANINLVKQLQISDKNIKKINNLHEFRNSIFRLMEKTGDKCDLRYYNEVLTHLEYRLQELWGFEKDSNFHRFWDRPHCTCPKMDNDDRFPTGHYVTNLTCLLHGGE